MDKSKKPPPVKVPPSGNQPSLSSHRSAYKLSVPKNGAKRVKSSAKLVQSVTSKRLNNKGKRSPTRNASRMTNTYKSANLADPPPPNRVVSSKSVRQLLPAQPKLSLDAFQKPEFDVMAFIDDICPVDIKRLDDDEPVSIAILDDLDLDALENTFSSTLQALNGLHQQVDNTLDHYNATNVQQTINMSVLTQTQMGVHQDLFQEFLVVENKFSQVGPRLVRMGKEIEKLSKEKARVAHGENLLRYYRDFLEHETPGFPVFQDFPRKLIEAAPVICQLKIIAEDVQIPGAEDALERITVMHGKVLQDMLAEFDKAFRQGDNKRMRSYADAIVNNFKQDRAPAVLFGRFVFNCLGPLAQARKRSAAYKLAAMQENLAILFRQIRTIVRTQYEVVDHVFPRYADEVMGLLVERLFNDTAHGLQPVLEFFLNPPHRKLPEHEYLQVLSQAQAQTRILAEELTSGLDRTAADSGHEPSTASLARRASVANGLRSPLSPSIMSAESKRDSKWNPSQARGMQAHTTLQHRLTSATDVDTMGQGGRRIRFDRDFVREQTISVFQPFCASYQDREVNLFQARCSNAFYAALPFNFVQENNEDLPVVEGVLHTVEDGLGGGDKKGLGPKQRSTFAEVATEVTSQVRRNSFNQQLSDIDKIVRACLPPDTETMELTPNLPMQVLMWGQEAHIRCHNILGYTAGTVGGTGEATQLVDENLDQDGAYVDTISRLFKLLCKNLLQGLLIPAMESVANILPEHPHCKPVDAVGIDKTDHVEDIRVVGCDNGVKMSLMAVHLPAIAGNNAVVKKLVQVIASQSDEESKEVEVEFEVFFNVVSVVQSIAHMLLTHWREKVAVSLKQFPNEATMCRDYLVKGLGALEKRVSNGVNRMFAHMSARLQATVLATSQRTDYNPKQSDGTGMITGDATRGCVCFASLLEGYIQVLNGQLGNNPRGRQKLLERITLIGRDILLANVKRSRISRSGAFALKADISLFCGLIKDTGLVREYPHLQLALDEANFLPQLFMVQPEHLSEMINEESVATVTSTTLCVDCVTRRVDYKTSFGSVAGWAKALFDR